MNKKRPVKIIIFTTCSGMYFSNMYLHECIVVVAHSHKYLHTPVISYLPLAPVPFSSRYFPVTRLNAKFSFPKHLGHSLQKFPFLQSEGLPWPPDTLTFVCSLCCRALSWILWGWGKEMVTVCGRERTSCSYGILSSRALSPFSWFHRYQGHSLSGLVCDRLFTSVLLCPWWLCMLC